MHWQQHFRFDRCHLGLRFAYDYMRYDATAVPSLELYSTEGIAMKYVGLLPLQNGSSYRR
jgi:hypothetical protein